jgi:heme exporter protein C
VPIVKYSVDWWNSLHQGATLLKFARPSMSLDMALPLYAALLGSLLFVAWCVLRRTQNLLLWRERQSAWVQELLAADKVH